MATRATGDLVRAASTAAQAGRTAEARRLWQQVVEREEYPVALNALGSAALADGDPAGAAALFARAIAVAPDAAALHFNRASACRALGDDSGERAGLEAGLGLAPQDLAGNIRLAELLERSGEPGSAMVRWSTVLGLLAAMNGVPPHLRAIADHASAFLQQQSAVLAEHVDAALASYRAPEQARGVRRVQAAVDYALGRRSIYLNQCTGLHVPFLPADEFFDGAHFPWFTDLEAATADIRDEVYAALAEDGPGFTPYVDLPPGVSDPNWDALNRSDGWRALHLWRNGDRDEEACGRFPRTAAAVARLPLAELPNRCPTVFFSVLAPRTHIPPHTGVSNARAVVHLPLIVPPGCRLRVGGETRGWREGEAFAFDDTIEHEAWNDSDRPRVVLILDCWNPYLSEAERDMLSAFYVASDNSSAAPSLADRSRLA